MSDSSGFRIDWARPNDTTRLVPLMLVLYRHDMPDAPEPAPDVVARHVARLLAPETPHRLLIAWDAQGAAAGLAAVAHFTSVSDPRPERWGQVELKELFVMPDHRSAGLGRALLERVETEARATGACRIDWHVKRCNLRGIAFYESFGGQVVQTRFSMRKSLVP